MLCSTIHNFFPQDVGENYYVGGGLFLLVFIAIGAFVFANLVVAVVVTNLVSECCFSTLIYFYYEGAQFLLHISTWVRTTVEALVSGHPRDENMLSARPLTRMVLICGHKRCKS